MPDWEKPENTKGRQAYTLYMDEMLYTLWIDMKKKGISVIDGDIKLIVF